VVRFPRPFFFTPQRSQAQILLLSLFATRSFFKRDLQIAKHIIRGKYEKNCEFDAARFAVNKKIKINYKERAAFNYTHAGRKAAPRAHKSPMDV
jgi:hypothetical protein